MTADEFWDASPLLAGAYREAHKLKQRQRNEYAWLQGLYFFSGVNAAVGNTFGGGKGKKLDYFKHPVDLGLETEIEQADKVRREREKIIANLTIWKKMWDARGKKSGEKTSQP